MVDCLGKLSACFEFIDNIVHVLIIRIVRYLSRRCNHDLIDGQGIEILELGIGVVWRLALWLSRFDR